MIDTAPFVAGAESIDIGVDHFRSFTIGARGSSMGQTERPSLIQVDAPLDIRRDRRLMDGVDHDNQLDGDLVFLQITRLFWTKFRTATMTDEDDRAEITVMLVFRS